MNESVQTGVAMAAIAMISTVAGSLVGWLKERDQLRYAKRATEQDAQIDYLTRQNEAQAKEMAELKADNAACQKAGELRDRRIESLERTLSEHLSRGTAPRPALPPGA